MSEFHENLMTQSKEGEEYQLNRTVKTIWVGKYKPRQKKCYDHCVKQCVWQIKYTSQGYLPPKIISDIDYTDESVVQFSVPVVENYFVVVPFFNFHISHCYGQKFLQQFYATY